MNNLGLIILINFCFLKEIVSMKNISIHSTCLVNTICYYIFFNKCCSYRYINVCKSRKKRTPIQNTFTNILLPLMLASTQSGNATDITE